MSLSPELIYCVLMSEYSLLAAESHAYFRTYMIASVAGIYSLFPLLFTPAGRCRYFSTFKRMLSSLRRNSCEDCVFPCLGLTRSAASQPAYIRVGSCLSKIFDH